MENERFYDLVGKMRSAQKSYFRSRYANAYIEARALEKEVDAALRRHEALRDSMEQKELF